MKNILSDKNILLISILTTILVVAISVNKFYISKNYDFIVEVSCNPDIDSGCNTRDCSVEDSCPPNNFESYKQYSVPATEFPRCENEDCAELCRTTNICQEVE